MKFKNAIRKTVLGLMVAASAACAQAQTRTVEFGKTAVTPSDGFVSALEGLGVKLGVVAPSTKLSDGRLTFLVTGGAVDLKTAAGQIIHSGGLTLTAGKTVVVLQSFIIDTTSKPVLTGLVVVNGNLVGRIPLFDLQLPAGLTLPLQPSPDGLLDLPGVGVTLDSQAAAALNGVFKVNAFKAGFDIGTATAKAFLVWDYSFYEGL
jgi:hypothetical protein